MISKQICKPIVLRKISCWLILVCLHWLAPLHLHVPVTRYWLNHHSKLVVWESRLLLLELRLLLHELRLLLLERLLPLVGERIALWVLLLHRMQRRTGLKISLSHVLGLLVHIAELLDRCISSCSIHKLLLFFSC